MALKEKWLVPAVKHCDGSIMIYGRFAAAATGCIVCSGSQINTTRDQAILKESVLPCVLKLGLGQCWIFL